MNTGIERKDRNWVIFSSCAVMKSLLLAIRCLGWNIPQYHVDFHGRLFCGFVKYHPAWHPIVEWHYGMGGCGNLS